MATNPNEPILDALGQVITKGSVIAYAVRDGDTAEIRFARVREIKISNASYGREMVTIHVGLLQQAHGSGFKIKNTYMTKPERAVVVSKVQDSDAYRYLMLEVKVEHR